MTVPAILYTFANYAKNARQGCSVPGATRADERSKKNGSLAAWTVQERDIRQG